MGMLLKIIRMVLFFIAASMMVSCGNGSNYNGDSDDPNENESPYTYYEFDGIFIFYETDDTTTYRQLLHEHFDMPDTPLVRVFTMDYYHMDRYTQPYLEAAVFLLGKYNEQSIWYCVTMPVTSDDARLGGISIGYPKIMGDITLLREESTHTGTLVLGGQTILELTHSSDSNELTRDEEDFFEEIKDIKSMTIVDGYVFDPNFGNVSGASGNASSIVEVAANYPDLFRLDVGTSDLFIDPEAAAEYSPELGAIFGMTPTNVIVSYYFVSKFTMRFRL